MKFNTTQLQTDFWQKGYCIFDNLIPEESLKKWRWRVIDLSVNGQTNSIEGVNYVHKVFTEQNLAARDGIGEYKFVSIDGRQSFYFPDLTAYYHSLTYFLSLFTGLDIVESWDKQSAVTMMNYTAPGGQIVPHYDTNGYTFLLYLTDNPDEGATELYPLTALRPTVLGQPDELIGKPVLIYPKIGRAVFFQGRKCWHRSLPVLKYNKISSVFNFYEKHDNWRPIDVSKRLYDK